DFVQGAVDIGLGCDIAGDREPADFVGDTLRASSVAVEDGHFGSGGGEPLANRCPNALAASRDQSNLLIESKKRGRHRLLPSEATFSDNTKHSARPVSPFAPKM